MSLLVTIKNDYALLLNGNLNRLLEGFSSSNNRLDTPNMKAARRIDLDEFAKKNIAHNFNCLYVLTNIVDLTKVGNTAMNVLRCIHLSSAERSVGHLVQRTFGFPDYMRLHSSQTLLQNIEIILKTEQNAYFYLPEEDDESAYVYLTLHFRKALC